MLEGVYCVLPYRREFRRVEVSLSGFISLFAVNVRCVLRELKWSSRMQLHSLLLLQASCLIRG